MKCKVEGGGPFIAILVLSNMPSAGMGIGRTKSLIRGRMRTIMPICTGILDSDVASFSVIKSECGISNWEIWLADFWQMQNWSDYEKSSTSARFEPTHVTLLYLASILPTDLLTLAGSSVWCRPPCKSHRVMEACEPSHHVTVQYQCDSQRQTRDYASKKYPHDQVDGDGAKLGPGLSGKQRTWSR